MGRPAKLVLFLALLSAAAAALAMMMTQPSSPAARPDEAPGTASAVFAGGCFWCTVADFDKMEGVISTLSGYTGGRVRRPTYAQVSGGGTGHIEAVRVVYDPRRISFEELVRRFLPTVDPLDAGGQFCDRGPQYRAAIFVAGEAERKAAEAVLRAAGRRLGRAPLVRLLPRATFWPAEPSHQDYARRNPVRYNFYRWNCGRDQRLQRVWGRE